MAKIKKLEGKKWMDVSIQELEGNSVFSYMNDTEGKVTAAVYEENDIVMIISNNKEIVNDYKKSGKLSFLSQDLQELLSAQLVESNFVSACKKMFGDCEYISLEVLEKEDTCTKEHGKTNKEKQSIVLPVSQDTSAQQQELLY